MLPIGHANNITTAAFSQDAKYVLTGSEDKLINLWDEQGRKINVMEGHEAPILSLAFSPNSDSILSIDETAVFNIWDTHGLLVSSVNLKQQKAGILHLSPEARRIFQALPDKIIIWNFEGEKLDSIQTQSLTISSLAYSPQNTTLAIALKTGSIIFWNVARKEQIRNIKAHPKAINSLKFSPSERHLMSSSKEDSHISYQASVGLNVRRDGSVKIWTINGEQVYEFKTKESRANISHTLFPEIFFASQKDIAFAFSRDSILSYSVGDKIEKSFAKERSANNIMAFSPKGNAYILTGKSTENFLKGRAAYVDLYKNENTRIFKSLRSTKVNALTLSPDKSSLILGTDFSTLIWNFKERKKEEMPGVRRNLKSGGQIIFNKSLAVGFSEDSSTLLSLNAPNTSKVISQTYLISRPLEQDTVKPNSQILTKGSLRMATFSKNRRYVLVYTNARSQKKNVNSIPILWDLRKQEKVAEFIQKDLFPNALAISNDGDKILIGYNGGFSVLWNKSGSKLTSMYGGKLSSKYRAIEDAVYVAEFAPDSKSFLSAKKNLIEDWSTEGQLLYTYRTANSAVKALTFSADGNSFVSGDNKGNLSFWQRGNPKAVSQIQAHSAAIITIEYLKDEAYILSSSEDNLTKIWTKNGEEVASLLLLNQDDWIVITPNGQFDASQGAMKDMHYVQEGEVIELSQLKERYYEPGLLSKLLGYNDEPIREVKEIKKLDLFPESELEIKDKNLGIKLNPREGGIGRIALVIEGREVAVDLDPQKDTVLNVNLEDYQKYLIDGEINKIGIRTYNEEGDLESQVKTVSFVPKQKEDSPTEINSKNGEEEEPENDDAPKFKEHARLFALCIGTSDYNGGEKLDLSYADKDAEQMANAIRLSADSLYIKDKPMVMVMNTTQDATKPSPILPSRNNIKAALDSIASLAKPQDIFILYLSGHGKSYNDRWYYLTYEINNDILSDATNRNERSISSDTLKVWMTQIAARKQILIVDACSSGKLNQDFDLLNQKDIPSSQRRALERLGDRAGLFVISASTANQVSYEASPYGMGLLTYALLMGMNGPALSENADVNVTKLLNFASQKVPTLASYINKVQQPMIYRPEAAEDYPIGRLPITIRSKIKIPAPKPLFSKTHFSNLESFLDDIGLMNEVNTRLREYNYLGAESQLIFIEGDDFSQAYKIAGGYTLNGEEVSVEVQVYLEGKKFGEKFSFTRKRSELTTLAEEIVGEAFSQIPLE
ncbi:MAG: caspase family protein [Bacteroidota bacterium]